MLDDTSDRVAARPIRLSDGPRYLFVRALEACNAGCTMCGFAFSKQSFRMSADELREVGRRAFEAGVRFVRFTGGEPLLHREIVVIVRWLSELGLRCSIITNGALLVKRLDALAEAGLEQVIVSIDSPVPQHHDRIRRVHGLQVRALDGLRAAIAAGLRSRVNTVCGPDNFRQMPALQNLLTRMGVEQWELSSLKLERRLDYTRRDRNDVERVVRYVYEQGRCEGRLVPFGKPWCGATAEERRRYFETGVTPRPDGRCHVVKYVRYLDARTKRLFPCSLLPHRPHAESIADQIEEWSQFAVDGRAVQACADRFFVEGPSKCTGCSTTAAGFSNDIGRDETVRDVDWAY